MSLRRTLTAAAAAVLTLGLVAGTSAAQAGSTHHRATASKAGATYIALKGGKTTLALYPATADALTSLGVSVTPVSEAKAGAAGISFPIQGGLINAKTLAGKITHSGGLTFAAGGTSVTVRDFTVRTTKPRVLTAWVDGLNVRVPLLNVNLKKAKIDLTKRHLTVTRIKTTLTKTAADALNATFNVTAFTAGLPIGKVTVSASSKLLRG
jgi:hypothetical protein